MSIGSPRVQPRRGAWGIGSRRATAVAAACSLGLALALAVPEHAAAYACGERPPSSTAAGELNRVSPDECRVAPDAHRRSEPGRHGKPGSATGLAVFVLAVAGALLIPIGRNGTPGGSDPFGRAPDRDAAGKSGIR